MLNKSGSGIFKICILILLMAGLSACEKIPDTGYSVAGEEEDIVDEQVSTPQPQSTVDSLFADEIQLSKTAFFTLTPQADQCHLAVAGNPLDVSIPDGTILNPGEGFVKIWRIRNAGDCAWTTDYSMIWFSGDHIGTDEEFRFSQTVLPGEVVELSVDMIAPEIAGIFQSNWKICDQDRHCFGLGSRGEYPFWVKIEVREVGTVTPSPYPTMTATSAVFANGRVLLRNGDEFNLDNEQQSADNLADIAFGKVDSEMVLAAINGAQIAWFGQAIPTEAQCQNLLYMNDSISLQAMDSSEVLCYKSSLGYPGYIKFNMSNFMDGIISIEFTTWLIP